MKKIIAILLSISSTAWGTGSLDFNGTTSVLTCSNAGTRDLAFREDSAVTICAWIRPRGLGENSRGRIFSREGNGTTGPAFHVAATNTLQLSINMQTDLLRETVDEFVSLNTWQFACVTWTGSVTATTADIYRNGSLPASYSTSQDGSNPTNNSTDDWKIGNNNSAASTFDGQISSVQIWTSTQDVASLKESMWIPGSRVTDLIGYWPLIRGGAFQDENNRAPIFKGANNCEAVVGTTGSDLAPPIMTFTSAI